MRYGTWEITSEGQNHSFLSDTVCTVCLYSMIPNVPNNNELWKPVWLTSFQKPQLQSVSIFFKFVHPNTVPPFVFAVVFFLRLTDFEKLCLCVSLNLVAVPSVWMLINFVTRLHWSPRCLCHLSSLLRSVNYELFFFSGPITNLWVLIYDVVSFADGFIRKVNVRLDRWIRALKTHLYIVRLHLN